MKFKNLFILITLILFVQLTQAKTIKYNLDISEKIVNIANKDVTALAIGNQIPGPTIEATVGDTLEVTFNNKMGTETSIHWHGVLLPNDQDGVPYLTTQPIAPDSSFTYRYKITHPGTYWYHSHSGLQEQRGLYGSLVFHPADGELIKTDKDFVVVFSDWTNEGPEKVLANLKKDGDFYALKKDSVQSWDQVVKNGKQALKNRLRSAWTRMGPMDLSDVGYDAFLSNGKKIETLKAHKGDKVRVRLVNAAASSYFNVEFAGGHMTIVAADGVDIEPTKVKRLRMAIAETYDVILNINEDYAYELRSTSEDGTGHSSTFIGNGEQIYAPHIPRPNLFLMNHAMHDSHNSSTNMATSMAHNEMLDHSMHHMANMVMDNDVIQHMTEYDSLRALQSTSFDNGKPQREVLLKLTGNMERYVWSFNNKTLAESDKILIKKGETVRIILDNQTMMHHPIHLHGHFFRVINKHGNKSPLKHTVNVPAMGKMTIEFDAKEDKDWFFHCHNLYHMKSGMARVISYEDTTKATSETISKLTHDDWYFIGDIAVLSNMTMGILKASNTRNYFEFEYDYNYKKEYDSELVFARSITRFFDIYAGVNTEREEENKNSETTAIVGMKYILPMLIESNIRINTKGKIRLALASDLMLTKRTQFSWNYNTDREYRITIKYKIDNNLKVAMAYDSDFTFGAGIGLLW